MKATLTLEFDNAAALHAFVDRMRSKDAPMPGAFIPANVLGAPRPVANEPVPVQTQGAGSDKTRKPRSDAGKPRGPYKKGEETTGEATGSDATSVAQTAPNTDASPSPTTSAAPTPSTASAVSDAAKPTPSDAAEPTLDDAKAALGRIKDTKGLGTPTCIGHLQSYGVNRISDLPKEKYAEFIQAADALIAKHVAESK